jgi:hypothetical protein
MMRPNLWFGRKSGLTSLFFERVHCRTTPEGATAEPFGVKDVVMILQSPEHSIREEQPRDAAGIFV